MIYRDEVLVELLKAELLLHGSVDMDTFIDRFEPVEEDLR